MFCLRERPNLTVHYGSQTQKRIKAQHSAGFEPAPLVEIIIVLCCPVCQNISKFEQKPVGLKSTPRTIRILMKQLLFGGSKKLKETKTKKKFWIFFLFSSIERSFVFDLMPLLACWHHWLASLAGIIGWHHWLASSQRYTKMV